MSNYNSSQFTFNRESFMLVSEASDLKLEFKRIYDDACDEGITIVSHRTGQPVDFVVSHIEWHEGDLQFWDLIPVLKGRIQNPLLKKLRVRIYND